MHFWTSSSIALGLATLGGLTSVSAHGYISQVSVKGQDFIGPKPGGAPPTNGIRPVKSVNPIDSLDSKALACGLGSSPAPASIPMKPGETITFFWADFDMATRTNKPWIHTEGPILTYLTPCTGGVGACTTFETKDNPVFFKIDEKGFKDGPLDTVWVQSDIKNGKGIDVTLPDTIADGEYLLRHEIIVLEGGEAQLYPACVQVAVTGTARGAGRFPDRSFGLLFPGAYKSTDPGLQVNFSKPYQFPGGPIGFGAAVPSTSTTAPTSTTPTLSPSSSAVATRTQSTSSVAIQTGTVAPTTPAGTTAVTTLPTTSIPSITNTNTQAPPTTTTAPAFAIVTQTVVVTVTQPPPSITPAATSTRSTSTITKIVTVAADPYGKVSSSSHSGSGGSTHLSGYKRSRQRRAGSNRISKD